MAVRPDSLRVHPDSRLLARAVAVAVAMVSVLGPMSTAQCQSLPDRPFGWFDNRLTVSADASVSTAKHDHGWYNDIDYGANVLRLATFGASVQARLHERVAVLGELRVENTNGPRVLALFARIRPWRDKPIDIQVGRIPPVFGTFGRRRYGTDNPLIGYPLAYQYLTTLRADTAPADADALLAVRGSGWFVRYPSGVGSTTRAPGLPLSSAYIWDTGVQVRLGGPIEVAVALTTGSLAAPRVDDDNRGKQLAARVSRRVGWLTLGASASSGAYLGNRVLQSLPRPARQYAQRAVGVDGEVSKDHWLLRTELVHSRFESPLIDPGPAGSPLTATAASLEGRYRVHPRSYVAARVERLGFSRIAGDASQGVPAPWDAPVARLEAGLGYYLLHNAVGKLVYQHNWRDGAGARQSQGRVAAQLSYWF